MKTDHFIAANIAVLTVSDTRTEETDTSGQLLAGRLGKQVITLRKKRS